MKAAGVVREAVIAACLTAAMILPSLGSWRATHIIAVSMPLAELTSLIALAGLDGLALAVGILVDDATVAIDNVTDYPEKGEPLHDTIRNRSGEIAVPTFVWTLSIYIVFVPMFRLSGVARYLFEPLAEAVVFAMCGLYFFSRTLIPTLAMYLMCAPSKSGASAQRRPNVSFPGALRASLRSTAQSLSRSAATCDHEPPSLSPIYLALCQNPCAQLSTDGPGKTVNRSLTDVPVSR